MARLVIAIAVVIFALACGMLPPVALAKGGEKGGTVRVRPYTKKDGTRVEGHRRTAPDNTKMDNWSTKGNVNPDTGKPGTKSPIK